MSRPIVITLPGGRTVDAQIGPHTLHTDQPVEQGGADSAPSPYEVFLASMGACAGIYIQGFCAARSIPFEGIRIVEQPFYDDQHRLITVQLAIELPVDFPAKYSAALLKVAQQCTVARTLESPPSIELKIQPRAA